MTPLSPEDFRVGQRLDRAMRMAGLSLGQLAVKTGLGSQKILEYLGGARRLADDGDTHVIAYLCGVSPKWLLTGESSTAASETLKRLPDMPGFQSLSETDRTKLVELIATMPSAEEMDFGIAECRIPLPRA